MGKNKAKTKKHKWDGIEEIIKFHKQMMKFRLIAYLRNWYFLVTLFVVLVVFFLFYFMNFLIVEKEAFFWLFAATSQSMAALFAVVGMFAVFRYQTLVTQLRNLYDVLKNKFKSNEWQIRFGRIDADCWQDDEIYDRAFEQLKIAHERFLRKDFPSYIVEDLDKSVVEISFNEGLRSGLLKSLKIPMTAILITFMLSIVSLPLTACLSKNCFGLIILLIMLVLITFSMTSILRYFIISISTK